MTYCTVCEIYRAQLSGFESFGELNPDRQLTKYYRKVERKWLLHVNRIHRDTSPLDLLQVQETGFQRRRQGRSVDQGER